MCHRGKKSLPKMYKRSEKVREDEPYMKIIFV